MSVTQSDTFNEHIKIDFPSCPPSRDAAKSLPSQIHFWVWDDVSCFLWIQLSGDLLPCFLLSADGYSMLTWFCASSALLPVNTGAVIAFSLAPTKMEKLTLHFFLWLHTAQKIKKTLLIKVWSHASGPRRRQHSEQKNRKMTQIRSLMSLDISIRAHVWCATGF